MLHAWGQLLVFTDPDPYPAADWIERLVTAWHARPESVVFGSIKCHGRRWLDRGVHLCKFSIFLPGGNPREVAFGWSGNVGALPIRDSREWHLSGVDTDCKKSVP